MPTRDQYVETIKLAALTTGTNLVMAYIIARNPFFSLPVVKKVTEWVVEKVLNIGIMQTELGAFFLFIDFRTSQQGRAFYEAAVKNQSKDLSPEEKKRAEKEVIDAFRALVKFGN